MNYTDITKKINELQIIEHNDLMAAVKAHGGKFSFALNDIDGPIVQVNQTYTSDEHASDFEVYSVRIDKHGGLVIAGSDVVGCVQEELDVWDVIVGNVQYITEAIPYPLTATNTSS